MQHLARRLILARRNGLSSSTVGKVGGRDGDDSLRRCSDLPARSVPILKEVRDCAVSGDARIWLTVHALQGCVRSAYQCCGFHTVGASAAHVHCDDHGLCAPVALSLGLSSSAVAAAAEQPCRCLQTCVHVYKYARMIAMTALISFGGWHGNYHDSKSG